MLSTVVEHTLDTLMDTIRKHARALADKEWYRGHNDALMKLLVAAELYDLNQKEVHKNSPVGTLSVGDREIAAEVIVKALRARFLERRTKALVVQLTEEIVAQAEQKVFDEQKW
ncbi:MAG: hypothetical protein JO279_03370 [Verrucomicrobia bacterium]|nr:hypothetical protein [Verrucomicrobiota bacterium]